MLCAMFWLCFINKFMSYSLRHSQETLNRKTTIKEADFEKLTGKQLDATSLNLTPL